MRTGRVDRKEREDSASFSLTMIYTHRLAFFQISDYLRMKLLNVILMLIFAIVGISAMGPVRARRSYSEAQRERNGK
ncbi:hypothetical protein Y032_0275g1047 [Ancylostoma ceylanicum]|uniref:Uncharacterized protein n=1 Tax=Ancylostoma ceylanicum TaxID=53326 RepID=A0A016S8I5_9BILA|nr:hypothetical protein Y032_0275g1047 [Ancylostoma ceylanicum]